MRSQIATKMISSPTTATHHRTTTCFIPPWNPWMNVAETGWRIILRPLRISKLASIVDDGRVSNRHRYQLLGITALFEQT